MASRRTASRSGRRTSQRSGYGSARKSSGSRRSYGTRTSARRTTRRAGTGAGRTIRLVIEQAAPQPVIQTAEGGYAVAAPATAPKRAKF